MNSFKSSNDIVTSTPIALLHSEMLVAHPRPGVFAAHNSKERDGWAMLIIEDNDHYRRSECVAFIKQDPDESRDAFRARLRSHTEIAVDRWDEKPIQLDRCIWCGGMLCWSPNWKGSCSPKPLATAGGTE